MAITTRATLISAVTDTLNRTDLDTVALTWLSLAETDIAARVRSAGTESSTNLTLDAAGEASLPSDYGEWRAVTANTAPRRSLDYITPSRMDEDYPYRDSGAPQVFTIIGSTIRVLPITSSTINLQYYSAIQPLATDDATNWLLVAHPAIYLYGTLVHSAPYLGDDNRLQLWGSMFENALRALEMKDERARYSSTRMRVKSPTP
jgi:hypothetical protein